MDQDTTGEGLKHPEKGYEYLRQATYLGRDRASLFLTAKGKKPAAILELFCMAGDGQGKDELGEDILDCRDILKDLELPYQEEDSIDEDDGVTMTLQRHLFLVGKDNESLEELVAARNADPAENYQSFGRRLGKALGYPETAIEADSSMSTLPISEYPQELLNDPAWRFCVFGLSRDHWKDEMDFVREQANFIKQEDPELYEAIVHD